MTVEIIVTSVLHFVAHYKGLRDGGTAFCGCQIWSNPKGDLLELNHEIF